MFQSNYKYSSGFSLIVLFITTLSLSACSKNPGPAQPGNEAANYRVTTFAGSGQTGIQDGLGAAASFQYPAALCIDGQNNVYVGDMGNFSIRKITPAGMVSTIAGGSHGFSDGNGTNAQFHNTVAITIDLSGNIYVADETRIRKISPAGMVSTLAGTTAAGFADGTGAAASFNFIRDMAIDAQGNIYVLDNDITGSKVRMVTPGGTVSGYFTPALYADGIVMDAQANIFISESSLLSSNIKKFTPSKVMTPYASVPSASGLAISAGALYLSGAKTDFRDDFYGLYRVNNNGGYTLIAGETKAGFTDGDGPVAQFNVPRGIAADSNGNIYVADAENKRIRKVARK